MVLVAALVTAPAATAAVPDRWTSPTGTGTACSQAAPCALSTGVQSAPAGSTVRLTTGTYPDATLRGGKATAAQPLVVTAAPGASPVLTRVKSYVANIVWSEITVSTTFYLYGANQSIESAHFDGGGLFVRNDGAVVRDSLFENGSSIDGIQVGGASDVLIEGNTVRDYDQDKNNGLHADCIQVFESTGVTLRGNTLSNCYNAGIIFSPGAGDGMSDITVESNFVQSCVVKTAQCRGGSAADFREVTASDLLIRNNTFVDGSLRVGGATNTVFDRNIVSYLAACDSPMTNTIVSSWNTKLCKAPALLNAQGNIQGSPRFVSEDTGDLRLVDGDEALIEGWGSTAPAARDIDGSAFSRNTAGAHAAKAGGPAPTPSATATATAAPTASPTATATPTATPTPTPTATVPVPVPTSTTPIPAPTEEPGATQPPAVDTTAPEVAITSPVSGAVIRGITTATVTATDDTAVTAVAFYLGSLKVGDATATTGTTWELTTTTAGLRGTFPLTARATDAAGNTGISAPVTITLR
ncbi:right-handed parallel beta-helix repeat-containing protein [Rathayibacter sp. SD072]|uniref:right-handed parallel beta-helix repeat-containing protein n=1 Tax=Rathayibacter sp. SD072 TaxID=2781731 RepID=UPI001A95B991|nr:right-handed parallel beta-helix repeat-containing protein [Rathayibacter sp. SD072]MBO0985729.1 right-handed parallel beta-helix repeat-containing protein [Rathayibacter sp. SD072]